MIMFLLLYMISLVRIFFKILFYFNWRIITLQYCDGLCHTSTWISHRYRCAPPSWTPTSTSLPTPSTGLSQSTGFGFPASYAKLPLVIYFTYGTYLYYDCLHPMPQPHLLPLITTHLLFSCVCFFLKCNWPTTLC